MEIPYWFPLETISKIFMNSLLQMHPSWHQQRFTQSCLCRENRGCDLFPLGPAWHGTQARCSINLSDLNIFSFAQLPFETHNFTRFPHKINGSLKYHTLLFPRFLHAVGEAWEDLCQIPSSTVYQNAQITFPPYSLHFCAPFSLFSPQIIYYVWVIKKGAIFASKTVNFSLSVLKFYPFSTVLQQQKTDA